MTIAGLLTTFHALTIPMYSPFGWILVDGTGTLMGRGRRVWGIDGDWCTKSMLLRSSISTFLDWWFQLLYRHNADIKFDRDHISSGNQFKF